MTTEDNVKLVTTAMEGFLRTGGPEGLLAVLSEDAVIARVLALADMTTIVDAYRAGGPS